MLCLLTILQLLQSLCIECTKPIRVDLQAVSPAFHRELLRSLPTPHQIEVQITVHFCVDPSSGTGDMTESL